MLYINTYYDKYKPYIIIINVYLQKRYRYEQNKRTH